MCLLTQQLALLSTWLLIPQLILLRLVFCSQGRYALFRPLIPTRYLAEAGRANRYRDGGILATAPDRSAGARYRESHDIAFVAKMGHDRSAYSSGTGQQSCSYFGDDDSYNGDSTGLTHGYAAHTAGYKRGFTLHLSVRKLRKMKRRQINRMNKDLELFRRVKERRLKNPNRLVDIRKINFINDKCNPALMRLPVSPLVDLNGLVPFKTVPQMTSQVPFNPAPMLHNVGFRFKPDRNGKYERFCEPYPMDEILQVVDARSLGAISRMAGKYKITGEGTKIPTPMDSQIVAPGASVGKGYGFGLTKKSEPKNKPIPLSNFKPFESNAETLVESPQELESVQMQARAYAESLIGKIAEPSSVEAPSAAETSPESPRDGAFAEETRHDRAIYESDIGTISQHGATSGRYDNVKDAVGVSYMDDVCNEGDIMRNPRYLGEYRYKYWYHPFYGNATMPGDEKRLIEEYNREHPDEPLEYEEYKVDLIYCHSNGTIVYLGEDQDPYTNQADDFVMEGEDPREPRFVVQAEAGFIKEHQLKLGQILPNVNSEMRERYYDNIFFTPKSVRRQWQVHLPDGTPVM